MRPRLRMMLSQVLLSPIMPCFMWGPFTHPHINLRALEKVEEDPEKVGCRSLVEAVEEHIDTYVYAANSADAISAGHMLHDVVVYDYAHNYLPDSPQGSPVFGYRLVDLALQQLENADTPRLKRNRGRGVAFACGWLSHQLADWVPHLEEQPSSRIGYANSHQVLTAEFYDEVLRTKKVVEHGLTEFLHDAYVLITDSSGYFSPGRNQVNLLTDDKANFVEGKHLVTSVSETFLKDAFCRIDERHLPSLERDFNIIIRGQECLIMLLRSLQPRFDEIVRRFVGEERQEYVDRSIERVVKHLFSLTREDIAQYARMHERPLDTLVAKDKARFLSVVVPKDESTLLKIGFQVGRVLSPTTLSGFFDEPRRVRELRRPTPAPQVLTRRPPRKRKPILVRLRDGLNECPSIVWNGIKRSPWIAWTLIQAPCAWLKTRIADWFLRYLSSWVVSRVKGLMLGLLKGYGDQSEPARALVRFVHTLLTSQDKDLWEAARDAYCSGLRPIASVACTDDDLEVMNEADILERMVLSGRIRIRFTSAKRKDKDSEEYLLNPETVDIRVNGYPVRESGTMCKLVGPEPDTQGGNVMTYEVVLGNDLLDRAANRDIRLFADIYDNRGWHSRYLDRQIRDRRGDGEESLAE